MTEISQFHRHPVQDVSDEHDWTQWFADPKEFRGCRFEPFRGWIVEPGVNRPDLVGLGAD